MRVLTAPQGRHMLVDGSPVVHFASNNYLDLAHHPAVVRAAVEAAESHGCAAAGSRLICGNSDLHEFLEGDLAEFLGVEAALVFSSGYMANVGVVGTLMRPGDIVLSDSLNHASIIDACRLARVDVRVFPHGDIDRLSSIFPVVADEATRSKRRLLLALDGVYSMDGDVAPLPAMVHLARRFGALVLLDDAHGFGALGARGRGVAELLLAEDGVDVYVGTLGKALGSFGAFVAGSARLRDWLVNAARTFLFTCALAPAQVAAARAGLRIVQAEPERRSRLQANANRLRSALRGLGIPTGPSTTQIVPVMVGENAATMHLCERLLERGYYAQGIRYPSVPEGTARLRIALMATHEPEEIDAFARAIGEEWPQGLGGPRSAPDGEGDSSPAT